MAGDEEYYLRNIRDTLDNIDRTLLRIEEDLKKLVPPQEVVGDVEYIEVEGGDTGGQ